MSSRCPAETPQEYWRSVCFNSVSDTELEESYELLGKEPDIRQALDSRALFIASSLRSQNFGDLRDHSGRPFEEKKNDPMWLICEAACLVIAIEDFATESAPRN